MVLWTIQRPPAWREMQMTGYIRGSAERVPPEWIHAYDWMRGQMTRRIGPPPEPDGQPVWCWRWYNGQRAAKPDLRFSGHLGKGEKGVRIEFECEPGALLLSDFEDWHAVLNRSYLAASPADDNAFDAELKARGLDYGSSLADPEIAGRIRRSWNRVFALNRHVPDWKPPPGERFVQACLWEVRLDQVRDTTDFVSH